jgi:hypothetical protein
VKQQTVNRSINRLQNNGLDGVMASRLVLLYAIYICYFSCEHPVLKSEKDLYHKQQTLQIKKNYSGTLLLFVFSTIVQQKNKI